MDKEFTNALLQLVAPVCVTAIASLIVALINTVTKIAIEIKNYNIEQHKLMQKFYPEFNVLLIGFKFSLGEVTRNKIYSEANSLSNTVKLILLYEEDESEYIEMHKNHIEHIVDLLTSMERVWDSLIQLSMFLNSTTIPAIPIFHPFLKKKVRSMLAVLQYFSILVDQYKSNKISTELFESEITNFPSAWECEVNPKLIADYIKTLDTWYQKF